MKILQYSLSQHALKRMEERRIERHWIQAVLESPERMEKISGEEWHLFKKIPEFGDRILKIVINPSNNKIITLFFDRRRKL